MVVGSNKKLGVRLDGGNDLAAIRAGDLFRMIVAMIGLMRFVLSGAVIRLAVTVMVVGNGFTVLSGAVVGDAITVMVVGYMILLVACHKGKGECGAGDGQLFF